MKKKLFEEPQEKPAPKINNQEKKENPQKKSVDEKITLLSELRKSVNSKIYEVYCKSVK